MFRFTFIILMLFPISLIGAEKQDTRSKDDLAKIKGKWEVVAVKRDGKPQHGQVGQAVGDVITVELNDFGMVQMG